jgi:TolB-like protein/Tfp pilus assembly protein PilF
MKQHGKNFYEFGPFRVDKTDRLLRRGTAVIPLTPKAVETLLIFLESDGQVLEKVVLMKRVWHDTIVEEGNLTQIVSMLRRVLGDNPQTPYIETIARRGYRFTMPVKYVREDSLEACSVAVLPLANLSNDPAQEFFADGMTDELINNLMKIEALRVCSRISAMAYKGVSKPVGQIARELDVDWVVEGAVVHSANRVRITARVIDGSTEKHLWAETYERDVRDVLALQSEVAGAIAREIRVKVTPGDQVRLANSRLINREAYLTYLRGRHFWNKRTGEDLGRAVDSFRQAIDQDPTYAPAHAGLADAYSMLGSIGYDAMPPREAMPRARAAANNALQIDDTLAEAHASLANVRLSYDWDWAGAEQEFKRSIELNPNYATSHEWYGHLLIAMGRQDGALRELRRALELDPLSTPCNLALGYCYYCARDFDQAIEQYRKTLELAPNTPLAFYELSLAYQNKKCYNEALAEAEKAYTFSGGQAAAVMLLGRAYALLGRRTEACKELARLQEMSKQKYVPAFHTASVYAGLNDKHQAFEWFQKARDERSNYLIYFKVEPLLDNLRLDSRFKELLRCVGLE